MKKKSPQVVFLPSQFKPTEWSTAQDKADFANHFVRFVESGFKESLFTAKFYQRMSMCRGHIAEYDRHGFYATWFETIASRKAFIERWRNYGVVGDPAWTYSDVERELQAWLLNREER